MAQALRVCCGYYLLFLIFFIPFFCFILRDLLTIQDKSTGKNQNKTKRGSKTNTSKDAPRPRRSARIKARQEAKEKELENEKRNENENEIEIESGMLIYILHKTQ